MEEEKTKAPKPSELYTRAALDTHDLGGGQTKMYHIRKHRWEYGKPW